MPEGYAINWAAVILAAAVGVFAMGIMFAASAILSPRRKTRGKSIAFECGIEPSPFGRSQLHIRYYIFAILFLIFDVEAVFLFPWAVIFLDSTPAVFYEMLIFIGILLFGILYGWRKGALQWR